MSKDNCKILFSPISYQELRKTPNKGISGIYKIENNINHKVYIGQSKNAIKRIKMHLWKEENPHLKKAFEEYGFDNFSFEILKETYDLNYWEIFLIQIYHATDNKYGYNMQSGGEGGDSEVTRKSWLNPESRQKRIKSLHGRTITEEHRKHLSESQKGRIISEETKAKIRAARQKQVITQESIEKRKASIAEYWASEKGQQQKRLNSEFMKTFCPKPTLGKRWYTNGMEDVLAEECPEGFAPGRCKTQVPCSEETKQKKRDWWINLSEEEKKTHLEKVSSGLKGHGCSDTCRSNISKANKGRHYYNNGVIEVMQFECPEGFVPGRLPSMAAKISKNLKRK